MRRLAGILAVIATLAMTITPLFAGTAAAAAPGNAHFLGVWQRTDKPVADLLVDRTWIWGPEGRTELLSEPYAEAPGGQRTVQYYDKSRMEITHPDGDPNSIWYVTNGLLVVELITGQLQIGDNQFEEREPAEVPVAGDRDDANGPTYKTFGAVLDAPPTPVGEAYIERLSRSGQRTSDPSLLDRNVVAAHHDEVTGHSIAAPFWAFMNSTGTIYQDGQLADALLFSDPLFGTGRPVSEAYWAEVLIAGTPTDVLMQCFERRCLTYNPANEPGWQVEAGNVGIHYYEWRYAVGQDPEQTPPPGDPDPGDPDPGDPPADPPPGDPPADPPPGDPEPEGEAPLTPNIVQAEGYAGGANGPFIVVHFDIDASEYFADGFRVYREEAGGFDEQQVVGPQYRYFEDFDVVHGGRYCYVMTAFNQYGESGPTDEFCVEVPYPEQGVEAPDLISPPDGYTSYDREIEFRWTPVPDVNGIVLCVLKPEYRDLHCDFNLNRTHGYILWMSGQDTIANGVNIQTLPEELAPDGVATELYWTVSACADVADDCVGSEERHRLVVDLSVELTAPALVDEVVDPNDPGRFTFSWDLVPGAQRYVLCVAESGASCPNETGAFYKSAVLGPTVDSQVLQIPLWLAPDGVATGLNWTVAACDVNLSCVWQQYYRSLVVDRTSPPTVTYPAVVEWDVADGWVRLEFNGPNGSIWEYHVGGVTYRVNADGTKQQVSDGGESLNYPLLIESDGTTWMLLVSADRQTHNFWRYDVYGGYLTGRSSLPAAAEAAIPLEFREPGGRQYGRVKAWSVSDGWVRLDYGASDWEYHVGGATYQVNADDTTTLSRDPANSLNYPLLIQENGTVWMLLVSVDRQTHHFWRFETGGAIPVAESDLPAGAAANIPAEFR